MLRIYYSKLDECFKVVEGHDTIAELCLPERDAVQAARHIAAVLGVDLKVDSHIKEAE